MFFSTRWSVVWGIALFSQLLTAAAWIFLLCISFCPSCRYLSQHEKVLFCVFLSKTVCRCSEKVRPQTRIVSSQSPGLRSWPEKIRMLADYICAGIAYVTTTVGFIANLLLTAAILARSPSSIGQVLIWFRAFWGWGSNFTTWFYLFW